MVISYCHNLQVVRDILGLHPTNTAGAADTGDNYENNYAMFDISNNDDHKMIRGNVPRDNYLRNDFLSINRMKFDVCTKEIFHNNHYIKLIVAVNLIKVPTNTSLNYSGAGTNIYLLEVVLARVSNF